jgi:wobble nucleotide-excising tRNase
MITRVNKIENFRVFKDFSWTHNLSDFKKYNLIFGWNGSGKTTLSDLFRQIEEKNRCPDCDEFEIQTTQSSINERNVETTSLMIKVYNQEFRDANISFKTSTANPIFFLGKENVEKQKEITNFRALVNDLKQEILSTDSLFQIKEKTLADLCISRASDIKQVLHSSGECEYNSYHRGIFRNKCELLKTEDYSLKKVAQLEFDSLKMIISSNPKPSIPEINLNLPHYDLTNNKLSVMLEELVISDAILRLQNDSELNHWVEEGLNIIKKQDVNICPFCEQKLPEKLIERLEHHFNENYTHLINEIASVEQQIISYVNSFNKTIPKSVELYPEYSDEYEKCETILQEKILKQLEYLSYLLQLINEKRNNPFKKLKIEKEDPNQYLSQHILIINCLIDKHNLKTQNFNESIRQARIKIEEHLVAEKMDEYLLLTSEISQNSIKKQELISKVEEYERNIDSLEIDIKEHRRPAEQINEDIWRYLGRDEIKLVINDDGYQITRYGKIAEALSEGEKTAITFIYFLKTLQDIDFNLKEGIVIIDDPISSLDSNSLHSAFQFMKNRTEDALQLIVLTHNYSFFREVKNWFKYIDNRAKKEEQKKCNFFMLQNYFNERTRLSRLAPLDNLLKNFDSEYHYLFSLVYKNQDEDPGSLENYYLYPNISRRLLESFLAFRVPSNQSMFGKMSAINFESVRKDRIYRFVNDNSHAGHIRLDADRDLSFLAETQTVSKDLMDMIKDVDGPHFAEMKKIIDPIQNERN